MGKEVIKNQDIIKIAKVVNNHILHYLVLGIHILCIEKYTFANLSHGKCYQNTNLIQQIFKYYQWMMTEIRNYKIRRHRSKFKAY